MITDEVPQPTLDSKEDQNSVGKCPVSDAAIAEAKARVAAALPPSHPLRDGTLSLCLLDGFLLYTSSMEPIKPYLDIKLFLRTSYAKAKARRENRDGYVTIEGFWTDPPGYVDQVVWPNYVEEHAWMFKDGDVEGEFRWNALEREGIKAQKDAPKDGDMQKMLGWTIDSLLEGVSEVKIQTNAS